MEKEIKINEFFNGMKKRLWLIIAISCLAAALGGLYSKYQVMTARTVYQSSANYLLQIDKPEMASAIAVIVKDQSVFDQVNQKLALNKPTDVLSKQITVVIDPLSPIMKVTASDPDPDLAAKLANTTGAVVLQQIGNLFGLYDNKTLSAAQPAKLPITNKSSNKMGLGFAVGIVLGIGLALLLESLDTTVQSAREVERLVSLPVLGSVSIMNKKNTSGSSRRNRSTIRGTEKGGTLHAFKEETYTN